LPIWGDRERTIGHVEVPEQPPRAQPARGKLLRALKHCSAQKLRFRRQQQCRITRRPQFRGERAGRE
jgi:hypothetical protein